MGTRSITVVKSRWHPEDEYTVNATIYRHWDGYPAQHGADLARFLLAAQIGNGRPTDAPSEYCNGAGELASHLVAYLVADDHNPSLAPPGTTMGQEWEYHVIVDESKMALLVKVYNGPMTAFGLGGEECTDEVFSGTVPEYAAWVVERGGRVNPQIEVLKEDE
jgi:hypothetical protein